MTFKSAVTQVQFRVRSNVKLPSRSTKKVGEKSHEEKRQKENRKTIEKLKKKWGRRNVVVFQTKKKKHTGRGGVSGNGCGCICFLNRVNSEHLRGFIFIWTNR